MHVWVYVHMCVYTMHKYVSGALGDLKRASDASKVEWQALVSHTAVPGFELWSSRRAANALSISLPPH